MNEVDWISVKDRLPRQGQKVLCERKGDVYVAIRIKDRFLCFPFNSHKFCIDFQFPELWTPINFPKKMEGLLYVLIEGEKMDMDGFEKKYPEWFERFADDLIDNIGKELEKDCVL